MILGGARRRPYLARVRWRAAPPSELRQGSGAQPPEKFDVFALYIPSTSTFYTNELFSVQFFDNHKICIFERKFHCFDCMYNIRIYRVIQKKLCTFLKHRHFFQEVRRDLKFLHDLDKCWEGLQKKFSFLTHSQARLQKCF